MCVYLCLFTSRCFKKILKKSEIGNIGNKDISFNWLVTIIFYLDYTQHCMFLNTLLSPTLDLPGPLPLSFPSPSPLPLVIVKVVASKRQAGQD